MIKIFETGDNHFGLVFSRYEEIKERLTESRYDSLRKMVNFANGRGCDCFVVTGDLFDSVRIQKKVVLQVAEILKDFEGEVLVLPGNHDYYD